MRSDVLEASLWRKAARILNLREAMTTRPLVEVIALTNLPQGGWSVISMLGGY